MCDDERKNVLVIGMRSGAGPTILANAWSAERVLEVVNGQIAIGKMHGFDMTNYPIDLCKKKEDILSEVLTILRSKHWDAVSIGYGIRGKEELTLLFEALINTVITEVQPAPKLVFSLRPSNIWEAVRRQYGLNLDLEAQPRRHTVA